MRGQQGGQEKAAHMPIRHGRLHHVHTLAAATHTIPSVRLTIRYSHCTIYKKPSTMEVCSLIWDLGLGKPVPHYLPKMVKTYLKLVFCLKRQARTPGTDQCYFWLYCTFLLRGISQPDSDIPSARYPILPLQQPPASNVSTDATASLSCNYKKASITTAKIVTRHTFPFY